MHGLDVKTPKHLKKCYLSECKNKAEFLANENGHHIRLCTKHYEIHQNKHQKFTKVDFKKASTFDK